MLIFVRWAKIGKANLSKVTIQFRDVNLHQWSNMNAKNEDISHNECRHWDNECGHDIDINNRSGWEWFHKLRDFLTSVHWTSTNMDKKTTCLMNALIISYFGKLFYGIHMLNDTSNIFPKNKPSKPRAYNLFN